MLAYRKKTITREQLFFRANALRNFFGVRMRRNSWAFGRIEGNARPTAAHAQRGNDVVRHSDVTKPTRSPQRHTRCKAAKFLVSSRRWSHARPPNVWQSLQSCANTDNPSYIGLSCPHDAISRASALSNPIGHKVVTACLRAESVTSLRALCFFHPRRQNIPTSFTHTSALMLLAPSWRIGARTCACYAPACVQLKANTKMVPHGVFVLDPWLTRDAHS